jgi:hypothetical protein
VARTSSRANSAFTVARPITPDAPVTITVMPEGYRSAPGRLRDGIRHLQPVALHLQ